MIDRETEYQMLIADNELTENSIRGLGKILKDIVAENIKDGESVMGLTPDRIRAMPEWIDTKKALNKAMDKLRKTNAYLVKEFKAELKRDRELRRRGV